MHWKTANEQLHPTADSFLLVIQDSVLAVHKLDVRHATHIITIATFIPPEDAHLFRAFLGAQGMAKANKELEKLLIGEL